MDFKGNRKDMNMLIFLLQSLQRELEQRRDEFSEINCAHQTLPLLLSFNERQQLQNHIDKVQQMFWEVQSSLAEKMDSIIHAVGSRKDLWSSSQDTLNRLSQAKDALLCHFVSPLHPDMVAKQIQEHRVRLVDISKLV